MCLLIFWAQARSLIEVASDLVIKYVHTGIGSSSKAYALRRTNNEEAKRKVRIASMMWNPILPPWCCKGGGGIVVAVGGGDGGGRWWCVVVLVMVVDPPPPFPCPVKLILFHIVDLSGDGNQWVASIGLLQKFRR